MNLSTIKIKHLGRTTLMFGVRVVSLKSKDNESGGSDTFLEVLASGTKTDSHVERMSKEILEFMLGEAKKGTVILVENHTASLRMGTSVDGRLVTNDAGELELYQTFRLDPNSSSARDLVAQMADPIDPYVPDCSVGLLNVAVQEMLDDATGESYKILLPIPETIYEHLALTRPDGQAYPDAALLAVGGKNALREITAKALTDALDYDNIKHGTPPAIITKEPDMLTPAYKTLIKARAAQVKAAVAKMGEDVNKIPAPPPGFGGPPEGGGGPGGIVSPPGGPGEVLPSGDPATPTSPAFPMPDESDDSEKNKLAPADAIADDPSIRRAKAIEEAKTKLAGLESMETKDAAAIDETKTKLAALETEAAKVAAPDPNALVGKTKDDLSMSKDELAMNKDELAAAKLAADKKAADEREGSCSKDVELAKTELTKAGYDTAGGMAQNCKGMREMIKAFRDDETTSPDQWQELAEHLHDELEMLETGIGALTGRPDDEASKAAAVSKARAASGAPPMNNKQILDEIISLRAKVQKLSESAVQRVPARLNDPSQLPAAEQAKLSIREELMKIKDPAERERRSFELVQKLNSALRAEGGEA